MSKTRELAVRVVDRGKEDARRLAELTQVSIGSQF
jgi:hypothetical protein